MIHHMQFPSQTVQFIFSLSFDFIPLRARSHFIITAKYNEISGLHVSSGVLTNISGIAVADTNLRLLEGNMSLV